MANEVAPAVERPPLVADVACAIDVRNVAKRYGAPGHERSIFEGLSLGIEQGRFLSILGGSGCGKSTLLQVIAGLQPSSDGEVLFRGERVTKPPPGMIYVFQQYTKSIFPWLTVAENVAFGLWNQRGISRKEIAERARRFIALVGLDARFENYYPAQLSGGMQQRVALARGLACEPSVLLMDEPFSAVDALTRTRLQELVLRIWDSIGLTIIFVTHDIDEAVFLSSRVVVMRGQPATIVRDLAIEIPYPRDTLRTREDERFLAYRHTLFSELYHAEEESA